MDPYDLLNKFYNSYLATVVGITDRHGFGIGTLHGN